MSIQVKIPGKAKGYFSVRTLKNGEVTQEIKDTNNIITDAGLANWLTNGGLGTVLFYDFMQVGTGAGNDEILGSFTDLPANLNKYSAVKGGPSDNFNTYGVTFIDNGDNTCTIRRASVYNFTIGQFTDTTVSSIGLWRCNSGGNTRHLFVAGQLIKNELGVPTTITIAGDEQLQVTYTIEITVSLNTLVGATGTIDNHGTPVGFTIYVHPMITKWPVVLTDYALYEQNRTPERRPSFSVFSSDHSVFLNSSNNVIYSVTNSSGRTVKNSGGIIIDRTYSPSSFNSTDIKTIAFGSTGAVGGDWSTMFAPFSTIGKSVVFYVVFDTPITKTGDESLRLNFDLYYTLTRA